MPCKNSFGLQVLTKFTTTLQSRFSDIKLMTTCDLVTILQRPFFNLLHKIIQFIDIMRFSDSVTKSRFHCVCITVVKLLTVSNPPKLFSQIKLRCPYIQSSVT